MIRMHPGPWIGRQESWLGSQQKRKRKLFWGYLGGREYSESTDTGQHRPKLFNTDAVIAEAQTLVRSFGYIVSAQRRSS